MQVAFGQFVFDNERHCLERQGHTVELTPKAFQLLDLLLTRQPKAVSKAELIDLLWPDVLVVDGNLANLILEVRRALSDSSQQPWIRTVRRYGYRFAGEIIAGDGRNRITRGEFRLILGGRQFRLEKGVNPLGRDFDSVVPMSSRGVSRHHAQILVADGRAVLQDLGSRNGTFVRGQRIRGFAELRDGDSIVLGSELAGMLEAIPAPESTKSLTEDPPP